MSSKAIISLTPCPNTISRKKHKNNGKKNKKAKAAKAKSNEYTGLSYSNEKTFIENKKRTAETKDFRIKWKTEICHYWQLENECKYGDNCAFAHGSEDIRTRKLSVNYKTKQCKQFFENGYCSYGPRCQFSHKSVDLSHSDYLAVLSEMLISDRNDEAILRRPRLKTFESLTSFNDALQSKKSRFLLETEKEMLNKTNYCFIIRERPLSI